MTPRHPRVASLDGLRGAAAVVVLIHHAALLNQRLASPYLAPAEPVTGVAAWLTYSPLHLAWAGTEAVYLFFVLSGLVLTLPRLGVDRDWSRYLPSRLVRLYGPVIAAVIFALGTTFVVSRDGAASSQWLANHPEYSPPALLLDLTLIGGSSGVLTPLWSLQWEVLFSLLLPLYLFIGDRIRPLFFTLGAAGLLLLGAFTDNLALTFLPMFAIGAALGYAWTALQELAQRVNRSRAGWLVWMALAIVSHLLTLSYWLLGPGGIQYAAVTRLTVTLGTVGLILVVAFAPSARHLFSLAPVQWLGRISFSLYLTHEPIVVACGFLLPERPTAAGVAAILIAFPVAWVFYLLVERPIHRLSRRVARRRELVPVGRRRRPDADG